MTSFAWFRTNVDRGYQTGEMSSGSRRDADPKFEPHSFALHFSRDAGFLKSFLRMRSRVGWKFGGPRLRDFQDQNNRGVDRCHQMNVAGLTITKASRQSRTRDVHGPIWDKGGRLCFQVLDSWRSVPTRRKKQADEADHFSNCTGGLNSPIA